MPPANGLDARALRWRCEPEQFDFETTAEVEGLDAFLGQDRAVEAVEFGVGIRQQGFNLYVLGPPGIGKRTIVRQYLDRQAAGEPAASDWCYVNNFEQTHRPRAIRLPAGGANRLRADMENLIEDLQTAIPAALETEEHQSRLKELENEAKQRHDDAFGKLAEKAQEHGIELVRTPNGLAMAPVRDGDVLNADDFNKLPAEQRQEIQAAIEALQEELKSLIELVPEWRKEMRDKIKELNREVTRLAIGHSLRQVRDAYRDLPDVLTYLDDVEADIIEHADDFRPPEDEPQLPAFLGAPERRSFQRYQVNVLVSHGANHGAPVVFEEHPNHRNLIGRVEHRAQMGVLTTDFSLIKAGALHRANGGYLVLELPRLLQQPYAWEGIKRALMTGHIQIESVAESLSLAATVSLEPEPIPLDVKIVLLGDRHLYYLLHELDRDFAELFKVEVDFEDELDRTPESCQLYARLIATLVKQREYQPFDRTAVATVIEHAARRAGDSEKLTAHMRSIADLLAEANYWAERESVTRVSSSHVEKAISKQIYRSDRIRQRIQEEIDRGTLLIDTSGERIGQINGLSVLQLGEFRFGRPSRITANTRLGRGELVDIEREVDLGGPIHSKGMLILSSLLATRYARRHPLSLAASVVFEQSYGMVDGDSASVAEFCAILSSIAEIPIRQSLAVTGSLNQHGQVQPIGGVNEKIEGFFDVCKARGLSGSQGVLVPSTNVKNLMLRPDVLHAVREGKFHVYAVETIDEALTLLTGMDAGELDADGEYPEETVNGMVQARLLALFELRRSFNAQAEAASSKIEAEEAKESEDH